MSIPSRNWGLRIEGEEGCFEGALLPRLSGRQKREKAARRQWTLFELIRQREREGGREGTSQVVVSTHPLSEMANRWRPPRSWYRRIIRFVTRYRTTLAVYLSTRETPGLGKYWFESDGVYFRRYRFYGVGKKRISFNRERIFYTKDNLMSVIFTEY